jgi:hypothetical protein
VPNLSLFFKFALASICLLLVIYFVHFNVTYFPFLSKDQADWASFGSFVGGTTGPLLAFLAYSGVRQQLIEQRKTIKQQAEDFAFEQHITRIKDSFERVNLLSINSVKPLESHLNINIDTCLTSHLKDAAVNSNSSAILIDIIHASRLIQSAAFIYQQYIYLINQSTKNLSEKTPLNEHRWCAIATWREFEKRAMLINFLAVKAERELLKPNPDLYEYEHKEILVCIASYETWERDWKRMGIGF